MNDLPTPTRENSAQNAPLGNIEGYHDAKQSRTEDADHGPCTAYEIESLGMTVYVYDNRPDTVSFHMD